LTSALTPRRVKRAAFCSKRFSPTFPGGQDDQKPPLTWKLAATIDYVGPMEAAGILAAALLSIVAAVQLALVFGAPWGDHVYGGRAETDNGRLSPRYRAMSAAAVPILLLSAAIVLSRAGVVSWFERDGWVATAAWVVFGYLVLNTVANLASNSRIERVGMGSLTVIAAIATLLVAM